MRSFKTWMRLIRLPHCLAIAAATWATSLYSGGPFDHAKQAAIVIAVLLTAGASLLHFSRHTQMYLCKGEGWVADVNPALLQQVVLFCGVGIVITTFTWLKQVTVVVVAVMALSALYTWVLSGHWLTKTPTILTITLSPFALGWLVGNRTGTFPWIPFITVGFLLAARELIKDVEDIPVDQDMHRTTFPMRFGVRPAENVAVILMALGALLLAGQIMQPLRLAHWPYLVALLLTIAAGAIFRRRGHWEGSTGALFTAIGCTVAGMIASVLVP